jgi:hypothetical protein
MNEGVLRGCDHEYLPEGLIAALSRAIGTLG